MKNCEYSSIYHPLRITFGLVPLLAGADKFTHILTDWGKYLPETIASLMPIDPAVLMMVVGVIEIVAGLLVLTKFTRLGAYIVMTWLVLIALVVAAGGFYDIAVRDLVMAVGAFTLGHVAGFRGDQWLPWTGHEDAQHDAIAN